MMDVICWVVRFIKVVVTGWANILLSLGVKRYADAEIIVIFNQGVVNYNNCCL